MNLDKEGYDSDGKPGPEFARRGGALWLYRGDGSDINDQLRGDNVTEPEVRDALDAAMRPIGKDTTLYRDSNLELEPGTVFLEKGYTSTAHSKGTFGPGRVKIDVPKNAPVIRIGDYYKDDVEKEVILGRGARFQVISKNHLKWIGGSAQTKRRGASAGEPWRHVLDTADRHAPTLQRLVEHAFGDARGAIDRVQLEMELSNKSVQGVELVMDDALKAMTMLLEAALPGVLLKTHNDTATEAYRRVAQQAARPRAAAAALPVKVKQAFDVTSPAAVAWVQSHAAELIDGIDETTRDDIKRLVESAFEDQFDVYDLADQIAEVIGDSARAEEIARTETMTASNVGQQDAWDQATEDGLLTGDELQEWIVTPDDRLCPICGGLDGVQAALGGMFEADGEQYDGPPAHPNCRCTVGLALLS